MTFKFKPISTRILLSWYDQGTFMWSEREVQDLLAVFADPHTLQEYNSLLSGLACGRGPTDIARNDHFLCARGTDFYFKFFPISDRAIQLVGRFRSRFFVAGTSVWPGIPGFPVPWSLGHSRWVLFTRLICRSCQAEFSPDTLWLFLQLREFYSRRLREVLSVERRGDRSEVERLISEADDLIADPLLTQDLEAGPIAGVMTAPICVFCGSSSISEVMVPAALLWPDVKQSELLKVWAERRVCIRIDHPLSEEMQRRMLEFPISRYGPTFHVQMSSRARAYFRRDFEWAMLHSEGKSYQEIARMLSSEQYSRPLTEYLRTKWVRGRLDENDLYLRASEGASPGELQRWKALVRAVRAKKASLSVVDHAKHLTDTFPDEWAKLSKIYQATYLPEAIRRAVRALRK